MRTITDNSCNGGGFIMRKRWSKKAILKSLKKNWLVYVFWLPAVIYIAVLCYAPMYGVQIAFRNYRIADGFFGSEWVGLKWFRKFFDSPRFWLILKNTLTVSLYSLVVGFPIPIFLALVMNNIKNVKYKKFAQTITYMPHFISTVVLVGMMHVMFSPRSGVVNTILSWIGLSGNYFFMGEPKYYIHMYVWSGIWQDMGWSSIIYMAALAGTDQSLHEAARIDGANKWQRMWNIDLPGIMPIICIMLIMQFGNIMSVGYEKVYLMQNALNSRQSEVISTYVYKIGLLKREYSYSTAIGLFNSVINFGMVVTMNKVIKKISGNGLW